MTILDYLRAAAHTLRRSMLAARLVGESTYLTDAQMAELRQLILDEPKPVAPSKAEAPAVPEALAPALSAARPARIAASPAATKKRRPRQGPPYYHVRIGA